MDKIGDRMKIYERFETRRIAMPRLPICIRLDGKNFTRFTKGLKIPWDDHFREIMVRVTRYLLEETCAIIGHTQSDEITLIMYQEDARSQPFFGGKLFKITSILASMATAKFNELIPELLPEKKGKLALFDCRVWTVPNKIEAINVLIWREQDATRNSIYSLARSLYSHKQLMHKNSNEMQEMIFQKGINWNDTPHYFKRGTFIQRKKVLRLLTEKERIAIPEKHRPAKDAAVERTEIQEQEFPCLTAMTNREQIIFGD